MTMKVEIKGLDKLLRNLKKAREDFKDAQAAALYQMGFKIDADAVPLVPVDTGDLRGSHYVSPPMGTVRPEVEVGFGMDYAVPVHERTNVHHDNGEAKFLEKAVNRSRGSWERDVAKLTKENYRKGIRAKSIPAKAPTKPKA